MSPLVPPMAALRSTRDVCCTVTAEQIALLMERHLAAQIAADRYSDVVKATLLALGYPHAELLHIDTDTQQLTVRIPVEEDRPDAPRGD